MKRLISRVLSAVALVGITATGALAEGLTIVPGTISRFQEDGDHYTSEMAHDDNGYYFFLVNNCSTQKHAVVYAGTMEVMQTDLDTPDSVQKRLCGHTVAPSVIQRAREYGF